MSKSVVGLILFGKPEATYGAGPSSALTGSTDAIQTVLEHPVFDITYAYDGNRNGASFSGGNYRRGVSKGRTTEGTVKIEGKGAAATYTLAVTPPNIHPFLLASGLSGSLQGASWLYKPQPLDWTTTSASMALNVYSRGELTPISGAVCTFTVGGADAGPAIFEFALQGLAGLPTTLASPPARTWIGSGTIPPNNSDIALTIGSFSPVVKSWTYDHGIEITDRMNLNAQDAHGGKALGRRNPTLKLTIEAPVLETYNPYNAQVSGTVAQVAFRVGTIANNRFFCSMSYAQIAELSQTAEGPEATMDITFAASVLDASSNDDVVWGWN